MRLIRLYIDQDLDIKKYFLDKNSNHYLFNVLRVKKDQKLFYSIILVMNFMVVLRISIIKILRYIFRKIFKEKRKNQVEIAFSICKNPCSDLIVQKLTELGINSIQPFFQKIQFSIKKKLILIKN